MPGPTPSIPEADAIPEVDATEAHDRSAAGTLLLDVREADEWEAGHASSATWIRMGDLGERSDELPTDTPIAVICRSGGRSAAVTQALLRAGYDAVNVRGGMQAWAAAGFPVVTPAGEPGIVA
jgi:rhodanese-related sulfurtransferase